MRISFHNRNFGYPVLIPEGDDYATEPFGIALNGLHAQGDLITTEISYSNPSQSLSQLVEAEQAGYTTLIGADQVFKRTSTPVTKNPRQRLVFNPDDYAGRIELIPYIVATSNIEHFQSEEHHDEFLRAAPGGFAAQPGMILAVGDALVIDLDSKRDISSVIDLQPTTSIEDGKFDVATDGPHLVIKCSHRDFQRINQARSHSSGSSNAALWPSLYLAAVITGINNLNEHPEQRWAVALDHKLRELGHDPDDKQELRLHALNAAQQIIQGGQNLYPLARMLDSFDRDAETSK